LRGFIVFDEEMVVIELAKRRVFSRRMIIAEGRKTPREVGD